jgi:hypothetical protein
MFSQPLPGGWENGRFMNRPYGILGNVVIGIFAHMISHMGYRLCLPVTPPWRVQ